MRNSVAAINEILEGMLFLIHLSVTNEASRVLLHETL
jgi:hypothetical protein